MGAGRAVLLIGLLAGVPIVLTAQPQPAVGAALQHADGFARDGRFTDAADAYRRILAESSSGDVRDRAQTGLTLSLLRTGDFAAARAEGARLGTAAGASAASLALYGDTLWSSGLFDEAERAYAGSLERDPGDPRAHHGRARSLAARGRLDEALADARQAIAGASDEAEFHHLLGVIYERQRRFAEAATAFGEYVSRLPDRDHSPRALWTRAEIRFLTTFEHEHLKPLEITGPTADRISWTVPVRIDHNKVLVSGRVNGDPLDFVLDTGAEQTVLSGDAAVRRGVSPISAIESAGVGAAGRRGLLSGRISRLQIGDLDVRNVPCLIKSPSIGPLPTREPDSFSPLSLGLSMTLDYANRELTLARTLPDTRHATELPLRLYRLATVRGAVNGTPVSFIVDTGGEWISISSATVSGLPVAGAARRIPLKVYGTSGRDNSAFLMPNVDIEFEALHLPPAPVVVLDLRAPSVLLGFQIGGILGHSFLSKYRVTIDLQRALLGLDPSNP